jgi:hypothetical protein
MTGRIPSLPAATRAAAHAPAPRSAAGGAGRRAALALCLLLAASSGGAAPLAASGGAASADPSDLCLAAARDAARLSGVPLDVLLAVALTESGHAADGRGAPRPWPWTVNAAGEGRFFPSRDEALAWAEARLADGVESIDLGCFQINHRWHGHNFVSPAQMLDPLANATYAAGYLAQLAAAGRSWSEAAGAYHSRTPDLAAVYRARFETHRAAARAAGAADGRLAGALALSDERPAAGAAAQGRVAQRGFGWPRPGGGGAPRLGSLVPLDG